jgi:hypothetical protein
MSLRMQDAHEQRLVEALKIVDAHGDVAPAHVDDPTTMLLRQTALQKDLIRWDTDRGRYVLTGVGRRRIIVRERPKSVGTVIPFPSSKVNSR